MIEAQINKLPHSADIEKRPLIAKKIMWEIQHAELDLYVDDIKFSNTVMRNAVGSHVYQTNKEAKEDLIYKISERNKDQYKGLDLNKKRPFKECIEMYRVITGACSTGTKHFIESNSIKKKQYSITEIINITKGQYGCDSFSSFFNTK